VLVQSSNASEDFIIEVLACTFAIAFVSGSSYKNLPLSQWSSRGR